jgi:hypothetical protein
MVFAPSVHGVELGEGLQAHGFISQGMSLTSDNNFGGNSDSGPAWDLREVGANLSWRPTPDWLISGQALARWAGETDNGDPRLDYGFVDRSLYADGETQVGVRLGKVKNPIGFYNTTRDVAHTQPGIIMPQSVYLDRIRDFYLAAPGVSLYGNLSGERGTVSWQINAVRPEVDDEELEKVFLLRDLPGRFEGENSWMGQISLDSADGRWRAGLSMGEFRMKYKPGQTFPFDLLGGKHRLPTWVASLERNDDNWSLTAEYSQTTIKARNYVPPPIPQNPDNTTEAWYVQATRRLQNGWGIYLRYDVLYLDKDDRDGTEFASSPQIAQLGLPDHSRFAKDWVLGVRRDLDQWMLSAEIHHVDGTGWLASVDNQASSLVRKWDMLLLQAAWRF